MKTLKQIIRNRILIITVVLTVLLLFFIVRIQLYIEQNRSYQNASVTLQQMEHILAENESDMLNIVHSYAKTCLHKAEAIAYIIQDDPSLIENMAELANIASFIEVDEINIFDKNGEIVAGTVPSYYGYTMNSGEQISFFLPMLEDTSLFLVQPITENSAEGKRMQYSAVWSKDNSFILQVGKEPDIIQNMTEKNTISHILSLFRINPEAEYYAINGTDNTILGSTTDTLTGMSAEQIGFSPSQIHSDHNGFYEEVEGVLSFCVFQKIGDNYFGRTIPVEILYQRIPGFTFITAMCLIVIAYILYNVIIRCMDRYVTDSIQEVNKKLDRISKGELDEVIDVHTSAEFSALSKYINDMVKTLIENNRKLSYVLSNTEMHIGVFDYNARNERMHLTGYTAKILNLNEEETETLTSDPLKFRTFMEDIRKHPVKGEDNIYRMPGETDKYIRLEEILESDSFFGICVDETENVLKRQKIEEERDFDLLTGLYNRRGLDNQIATLFSKPENLGVGALIMIDADGLKVVNDTYGHENGDLYLKKISEVIHSFGSKSNLSARQGGDEFVLLLYHYENEEDLMKELRKLEEIQEHCSVLLNTNTSIPIHFSYGYSLLDGTSDYQKLFKEADQKMYQYKKSRKSIVK